MAKVHLHKLAWWAREVWRDSGSRPGPEPGTCLEAVGVGRNSIDNGGGVEEWKPCGGQPNLERVCERVTGAGDYAVTFLQSLVDTSGNHGYVILTTISPLSVYIVAQSLNVDGWRTIQFFLFLLPALVQESSERRS